MKYIGLFILVSIAFCMGHPSLSDPGENHDNHDDSKNGNGNGNESNCTKNDPKPSIFDLNRAIAYCNPEYIQQTCYCDCNDIYITKCLCKKMREIMPDFPEAGCLSMEDVGCEFDKYVNPNEKRECSPEEEADEEEDEEDDEEDKEC